MEGSPRHLRVTYEADCTECGKRVAARVTRIRGGLGKGAPIRCRNCGTITHAYDYDHSDATHLTSDS